MTWGKEEKTKIMKHFLDAYNESMKEYKDSYDDLKLYPVYEEEMLKTIKENDVITTFHFLEEESELLDKKLILEVSDEVPGIDAYLFLHLICNENGDYYVLRKDKVTDSSLLEYVKEHNEIMDSSKYDDTIPF